jgi:RimJ/RimL family protein N-acetyltransferase
LSPAGEPDEAGGMLDVPIGSWPLLADRFGDERPGPLIYPHAVRTGLGRIRVDRWPDPRVVLAELPSNYALRGDPDRLDPAELADVIGFVDAEPAWLPALRATDPGVVSWPRLIAALPPDAPLPDLDPEPDPDGADTVRRLGPSDVPALRAHDAGGHWIWSTWGGPEALADAGVAHGAFVAGALVSIAVPFYLGRRHGDLGVVTDPGFRGRGLSTRCAGAVAADVRARGLVPTWTTSPDNAASRAVAARLGFVACGEDVLYVVRTPVPT